MRRIINGCYRDFVDTKPCRWEKPKPEKGRKPNWNENQSTSRIEYQGGGNYIHYSLTWCHRQVLCLSLFTLVQRLLKLVRAIWFIKLNQIFSKFTENSFSETLYQLNLLYLKYGVAATQCGLLLCRHGWPIDWSLLCRKYGSSALVRFRRRVKYPAGVEVRPANYLSNSINLIYLPVYLSSLGRYFGLRPW